MESAGKIRELVRLFIRNLEILHKSEASCCGITIGQCHAIVEIGRAGSISLNELALLLNLDNSTMSRTVNNLVQQELAEREADPQDRRFVSIRLTEKGGEVFRGIEEEMTIYFNKVFADIPERKRDQVIESLELLLEAVRKNKCCS
ncbi:DNA-binding transcriptional regulator, MarR family [Geosporobacter subterraneus DSM 17957]|uniref:DNA-binding transcriptional regulator, MarR family n=1 Tax=Geosporobacter subterraneus DSM 17957 TaxID=1121919 RepID=A0A1M6D5N5_9FIRM|nr:MarR family transcriptional regulator [Geosporobacter subterraneus]SHI68510.1 DNA-binding transcriptional regulator, MarR family [Geosporobacter subterraneus DSM 17957]